MSNSGGNNSNIINLDKYYGFKPNKNTNNHTIKNTPRKSPSKYVPDIFELTIPDNLFDALLRVAPNFFRAYKAKLSEKIKQNRKVVKLASPGKNKTLKGQNALPKKAMKLSILRDAYLSDKTPRELYDWWSSKLDQYGMAAKDWYMTWPEIGVGYYNQITNLSNSYNKYPPLEGDTGWDDKNIESVALEEYLGLVEQIYKTCIDAHTPANYELMMDAQIAYVRLTQIRHTGNDKCEYVDYFKDVLEKTKNKPILLLPQSIFGKVRDFIKFYSIPVIPFLSVYKEVHGRGSTPCVQINHDIEFHSNKYINLDLLLLDYNKPENIRQEFNKRQQIISTLLSITGDDSSKTSLVNMFFNDIHERIYNSYLYDIYKSNGPSDFEEKIDKIYMWPKYIIRTDERLNYGPVKYDFSYSETNIEMATIFEKYIHILANIIRESQYSLSSKSLLRL